MSDTLALDVYERARAWADADPDPVTQGELRALIHGRLDAIVAECMAPELDFGTAGLRGAVGPGPGRMNQAVITRAVRAVAEHLLAQEPDARSLPVVVGYDARPTSRRLAEVAAGVLLGAGLSVRWFEQAVPTPLVAYAARVYLASAALVVTASHNPRGDNGLKVYGGDACQLGPPADADIARRRDTVGAANAIRCVDVRREQRGELGASFAPIGPELFQRYLAELDAALPARAGAPELEVAYTPLHGVGGPSLQSALALRGFTKIHVVSEQIEPDGSFPTTPFPNPEQPGTLDRVLALAEQTGAGLVIANDPDADRLAVGARDAGRMTPLTGNELGVVLADFVLERAPRVPLPLLVTSIVSTPLLSRVAEGHGAHAEVTLTGFKWIWRAARELEAGGGIRFAFGCEEALGYSIGHLVRDKDGIAAAVWIAELAERCRREGGTLFDRLDAVHRRHGAWGSAQRSLTRPGQSGLAEIRAMTARLAARAPDTLAGLSVRDLRDFREGAAKRPAWLGTSELFELALVGGARVLVRPSGTEPKLKVYADAVEPVAAHTTPRAARLAASAEAARLAEAMVAWLDGGKL